ncbi:MAG: hypothetical protein AAFQ90_08975 [Pseudomonadota bacterium]
MKKTVITSLIASAAFFAPQAAFAQGQDGTEVSVGAIVGYHDLGAGDEIDGFEITDNGVIFGGFVAVDFPVSENIFAGIEGNAAIGTDAIDAEYGASVRLGYRASNGTKIYLRGGYQEVDIDAFGLVGLDDDDIFDEDDLGIDTTAGDYLVGGGVDIPVGGFDLRFNLDTIAFDTVRATAGVGVRF